MVVGGEERLDSQLGEGDVIRAAEAGDGAMQVKLADGMADPVDVDRWPEQVRMDAVQPGPDRSVGERSVAPAVQDDRGVWLVTGEQAGQSISGGVCRP